MDTLMWPKKFLIYLFHVIVIFISAQCAASDAHAPLNEQKIKAGLVYNLIKYTEWPPTSVIATNPSKNNVNPGSLKICLLGGDPFDDYLSPLEGRTAQQAVISIVHISEVVEATGCNTLIIHRNQREHLQQVLEFLHGKSILTISDLEKFADRGGMIELARNDEKIALHINKNSVDNAKLVIDGRMLKLAQLVSTVGAL